MSDPDRGEFIEYDGETFTSQAEWGDDWYEFITYEPETYPTIEEWAES